jgi:hypothetical protein
VDSNSNACAVPDHLPGTYVLKGASGGGIPMRNNRLRISIYSRKSEKSYLYIPEKGISKNCANSRGHKPQLDLLVLARR